MRISNLPFVGLLLLLCGALRAQSGCPGCLIELPPLPADTIFLSQAPDGQAGQPYDGDLSFRMPQTTTPVAAVDSTVPAGLTLDKVTILSVVNLPPGLSWEPSQFEFNPSEQTDGCVKLCGTPLQPGLYEVSVIVSAEISLISQTANFDFDIYIAPAASQTDGFSMTNTTGCGSTTVAFQNLLPSNDQPGISYWWDFGNGQTSALENPDTVRYDSPGIFPVHYTATFDTVGHLLTAVTILDVGCGDVAVPPIFNGNPDLFIEIENPAGDRIFKSDVTDNAGLPLGYTFLLPLDTGTYTLHVKDDEFLIGDEHCGTVTFSRSLHDTLTDGDLQVLVQVVHPVFTVEATDTVRVFPQPDPPLISPDSLPPLCDGQPVQLFASYTDGLQWYRDSSVLFGDTSDLLTVTLPGSYWVEYTSPDGCKSQSQPVRVEFIPLPSPPIFTNDDNFVSLNDPAALPDSFALQWLLDGQPLEGATDSVLCIEQSGLYSLVVTDLETQCSNQYTFFLNHNPAVSCSVAAGESPLPEGFATLAPNPNDGRFSLQFEEPLHEPLEWTLVALSGQAYGRGQVAPGTSRHDFDYATLPPGLYFLKLLNRRGVLTLHWVKSR